MLLICGLLFAMSSAQASQPDSTGRIAGRVTVEGTNSAVAGVRIIVFPSGRPMRPMGPPPQTTTDQDGRFALDRLAPGGYRVDAQKTGFVSLNQPGRDSAVTVDVAAGRVTTFDLKLQKGGVIAGRVLDSSGEPMADVSVMALRPMPARSGIPTPRLMPAGGPGAQTNDIGEFRVSGLAAGEYYIAALPRSRSPFGAAGTPPPSGTARITTTTTFYPGTISQEAAQPITVAAGAEVTNISFVIQSEPAFRVSGIVVDENGDPVAGAMVRLMSDPRSDRGTGMVMGYVGNARSGDDGRFVVGDVTAGSYRISASIPMTMSGANTGGGVVTWSAGGVSGGVVAGGISAGIVGGPVGIDQPTEVVVTDADVSGVRVTTRRPARE